MKIITPAATANTMFPIMKSMIKPEPNISESPPEEVPTKAPLEPELNPDVLTSSELRDGNIRFLLPIGEIPMFARPGIRLIGPPKVDEFENEGGGS